jgi:ABC-type cobalamin/Fe3+-siderophores transport system ATPase subunit
VVTRLVLLQSGKMVAEGLRDAVPTQEAIQDVFQVEAELVATKAGEPLYFFHPRGLAPS